MKQSEAGYISRRRWRRMRRIFYLVFSVNIIALCVFFLIFSDFFVIRAVEITGVTKQQQQVISDVVQREREQTKYAVFSGSHILFFNRKAVLDQLFSLLPELASGEIKYNIMTRTLTVAGSLRQPVGKICRFGQVDKPEKEHNDGRCYFFDRHGVVFGFVRQATDKLWLIEDRQSIELQLGQQYLPEAFLVFVSEFEKLSDGIIQMEKLVIEPDFFPFGYFKLVTHSGWYLFLGYYTKPDLVSRNLERVLSQEIKEKSGQLEYIDLRLEDRAYYKLQLPRI